MVVRSALANGMDWQDLDDLVQAETANGNPIASLIHELRLDRNKVRIVRVWYRIRALAGSDRGTVAFFPSPGSSCVTPGRFRVGHELVPPVALPVLAEVSRGSFANATWSRVGFDFEGLALPVRTVSAGAFENESSRSAPEDWSGIIGDVG